MATQANAQEKRPQHRARRETNASREARIARTVSDTYSHRYEIFGGGGFLRFTPGQYLKKDSQVSWAADTTYFLHPKFGLTASAQGSFGHAETLPFNTSGGYVSSAQINEYYFLAGPSYRFYMREKVALTARAQAGIGWGIFGGGSKGFLPEDVGLWKDQTRPAWSLNLNGDYNFYPNMAFRVTPTYIGTSYGSKMQSNFGFNAGFVYRFGRQQ
ncbi:MAG: hypothetical protein ABI142_00195 [Bryocella sp.]